MKLRQRRKSNFRFYSQGTGLNRSFLINNILDVYLQVMSLTLRGLDFLKETSLSNSTRFAAIDALGKTEPVTVPAFTVFSPIGVIDLSQYKGTFAGIVSGSIGMYSAHLENRIAYNGTGTESLMLAVVPGNEEIENGMRLKLNHLGQEIAFSRESPYGLEFEATILTALREAMKGQNRAVIKAYYSSKAVLLTQIYSGNSLALPVQAVVRNEIALS